MKIAIYARVSTGDQRNENQLFELEKYAKSMGYEYTIFEEKESTRKTRPIKQDLFNRLRHKEFDGVLVLKLDRWARSLSELVLEVRELYDKGVAFISRKDNIDLSTATGQLQFHILAAFANFERELIRERTLDALAERKNQIDTNKFFISKAGKKVTKLGRPKDAKDKKPRKKGGYYMRYIDTKQSPLLATASA